MDFQIRDILSIIAIITGPIIAVQMDKFIERNKDKKNRKVSIFKTLMATRGSVVSHTHVEALNRIILEFSDNNKYKKVINSWEIYLDNLQQPFDEKSLPLWSEKNNDLLTNLLYEMNISLGYKFDKEKIKKGIYIPKGHITDEREQITLRKTILDVLNGERSIPMSIYQDDNQIEKQNKLQDLMIEYYQKNAHQNK